MALSLGSLFFLYALFAFHAFSSTGPQTRFPSDGDTIAYLRMAALPVFSRVFFFGERAIVYALLLKAVGSDLALAGWMQTFVAIGCWGFLAWASLRLYATSRGKIVGFAAVLLCAAREEVLYWNSISMSESLSFSLFALWIGSWIMFARGGQRFWKFFPLLTSFLFAFVRDTNAFLVLGAALVLAIACAFRLSAPRSLLLSLALVLFFGGSLACRSHSIRPAYSFMNTVGGRILADEWLSAELRKYGMPGGLSTGDKKIIAGRCGNEYAARANILIDLRHSAVVNMVIWQNTTGLRDYLAFLAQHPAYLLLQPFREDGVLRFLFPFARWIEPHGCSSPLGRDLLPKFRTLFPQPVRLILQGDPPSWFLVFWALTGLGCGVAYVRHRRFQAPFLWTLLALLAAIPHLLVVWHGDALDVPRHALLAGIQVHLALAIAFALACDALAIPRAKA